MQGVDVEKIKNYFNGVLEDFEKIKSLEEKSSIEFKGDDVDIYNEEKQRDLSIKLKKRNLFFIKKVKEALGRIEEGTFGECLDCGDEIGSQRLLARPTASLCISCKEEQESIEGQTVKRVTHPSLRKERSVINVKQLKYKTQNYQKVANG